MTGKQKMVIKTDRRQTEDRQANRLQQAKKDNLWEGRTDGQTTKKDSEIDRDRLRDRDRK